MKFSCKAKRKVRAHYKFSQDLHPFKAEVQLERYVKDIDVCLYMLIFDIKFSIKYIFLRRGKRNLSLQLAGHSVFQMFSAGFSF